MPFFLIFLMLVGCTRSVPSGTYAPLIEAFNRYETEEARYFERLVFTVSPKVFSNSNTFKVLLRDQTGEEWLFKSSENGASDGIVLVYRIMNLFGMDSPEAHYKTISFNGQMVAGTVQRFIPNRGGIPIWVMRRLKGDPAFYMAKNHVMSWLLANHQVHPDQFLVLPKEPGPVREILRIDNSVNWFLLGQDRIDIDYRTPVLHDFGNIGYLRFWQFFLSGKILISLPEIYQWARFVAGFPDSKYLEFFAPAIKHNLS